MFNREYGNTGGFKDLEGHEIYLWQPPPKQSKNYKRVSDIVHHYEKISSRLEH